LRSDFHSKTAGRETLALDHRERVSNGLFLVGSLTASGTTGLIAAAGSIHRIAAKSAAPRIIEGVDASTLVKGHSIGGSSSIKRVGKIADSMRVEGYIGDPIRVIQSDGHMIIVDGHHRTAAARMTNTPVNVEVVGPEAFPMGSGGWRSIDEVIQGSQTAGPNRLNKPGRKW